MKENVSHTLVGQKTRIYAILFLFLFLSFAAVSGWLFFSMSRAESPDPLLVAMSVIVTVVAAVFLLVTILCFSQKKDAVFLYGNTLIIRKRKEYTFPFAEIEDIQYRSNRTNASGYRSFSILACIFGSLVYKSGTLFVTPKNGKEISVPDVKNVQSCCAALRKKILNDPPETDTSHSDTTNTKAAFSDADSSAAAPAENSSESVGDSSDGTKSEK